jgi:hypothetical protein
MFPSGWVESCLELKDSGLEVPVKWFQKRKNEPQQNLFSIVIMSGELVNSLHKLSECVWCT